MKLCLACFRVCEDSAETCPHCGYGSIAFKEYVNCLPIGTKLGGRFTVGGVCSLTEDFTTYYACDMQSYAKFRIIEYAPRSLIKTRRNGKLVFLDEASKRSAEDFISKFSQLNVAQHNSVACFEENSTYYIVEKVQVTPIKKAPPVTTPATPVKKIGAKEIIRKTVLALCILCIVFSSGYLLKIYVVEPLISAKRNNELAEMMNNTTELNTDPQYDPWPEIKEKYPNVIFPEGMNPAFADLYALNPETAGRIKIENTDVDFVVMQTTDNDKYLKTDFDGNETNYGQPYFDYRNDLLNRNRNLVVYGHNMRHDDKIFGALEAYRNPETFKKSPVINISTLYGDYTYKIYGVYIVNADERDDVSERLVSNFIDVPDEGFLKYIEEIDKRKLYETGVDIVASDKILTLCTCCYDFDNARLIIVARQTRAGESTQVDTSLVKINNNPKYPQAYYNAANLQNPYKDDKNVFAGY